MKEKLKVVPLVEGRNPLTSALHEHIEELIFTYCDDREVSFFEVVGVLEFVKQRFIERV